MRAFTILAASDKNHPTEFGKVRDYKKWVDSVAAVSIKYFDALYFVPDSGTYVDFAKSFKKLGGKIYAVIPTNEPALKEKVSELKAIPYYLDSGSGWTYLNTHFIGLAQYSICLSYSPGSILEICSAKYLVKYENKKIKIFIDRSGVSKELPPELTKELPPIYYFNDPSGLDKILTREVL